MSATINLIGRLGRDPDIRQVNDNIVCALAVAVDCGFGDRKTTVWYDGSIWGKSGEVAQKVLRRGSQVAVCGEHEPREYQGKDGTTKTAQGVRALSWQAVGAAPQQQGQQRPAPAQQQRPAAQPMGDAEIPF